MFGESSSQAHVNHVGVDVGRVHDPGYYAFKSTAACVTEHLDQHQLRLRRDTDGAEGVIRGRNRTGGV